MTDWDFEILLHNLHGIPRAVAWAGGFASGLNRASEALQRKGVHDEKQLREIGQGELLADVHDDDDKFFRGFYHEMMCNRAADACSAGASHGTGGNPKHGAGDLLVVYSGHSASPMHEYRGIPTKNPAGQSVTYRIIFSAAGDFVELWFDARARAHALRQRAYCNTVFPMSRSCVT